ncbi:MAG TPA: hypothetical protein VMH31_10915 [Methylomirabilota bacterium]|nr:hypothetical protein [Methylomirabilota bacterium]
MSRSVPNRRTKADESGYAIVIVMFFLALLVILAAKAAPTVLSEVQREKEADMVWKGEQYARGVKLYYVKTKKFPTSLEDLTTNKTGIRFMRQAYKDPMNKVDGSWRLIYVGPNGQLIGSLKNRSLSVGGQPTAPVAGTTGTASQPGSSFGSSSFGSSSFGSGFGSTTGTNANSAQSSSFGSSAGSNSFGQPQTIGQPLGMMDASNVIGGNIIGVGSKVDKKSFLWYDRAKTYREFEFIWDPSKDLRVGGASQGIGTPVQNLNGNGAASSPTSPQTSPFSNSPINQNPTGTPDPTTNPPLQGPPSPN